MFANILSGRHSDAQPTRLNHWLVGKVDAALAELPAPWQILRNRRASAADGPPWAKYIAFHPRKGIALIDLLPANPHAAIAPLDDFLRRTGFAAFSRGDPPIIAVALAERDVKAIASCLSDGFAAAPRCGIENASWTDAAIELLVTTPGLLLTRLERSAELKGKAREPGRETSHFEAPPHQAAVEPEPPETAGNRNERTVEDPVLPLASKPTPLQASARRDEAPAQAAHEPRRRAEPNPAHEPKLGGFEEPDWRSARLTSFEHRGAHRRRGALWLAAVPIAAGAIAFVAYPQLADRLSGAAIAPQASAPEPTETPSAAAPNPSAIGAPSNTVIEALPSNAATPALPETTATPITPAAKVEIGTAAKVMHPTIETTPKTVSRSQPTAASDNGRKMVSGSQPASQPAARRRVKMANVKPEAAGPIDRDAGSSQSILAVPSQDAAVPANGAPPPEESVTIDGTTFVKGREPHALGVLTEPPVSGSDGNDPQLAPASPVPPQIRGYNGALIQPE